MLKEKICGLFLLFAFQYIGLLGQSSTTRYVFAPSGLNLRVTAAPSSEKLLKVPYGDAVNVLRLPEEANMKVDNFTGGMAKVLYQGKEGYLFDGYITRFPLPEKDEQFEQYVEKARAVCSSTVVYESHQYDYDGYSRLEEVMVIPSEDFEEVYLLAKALTGIPKDLYLSDPASGTEEMMVNPHKEEVAWSDELTVKRALNGALKSINYGYRTEGFGWSVRIEPGKEKGNLRLTYARIAD